MTISCTDLEQFIDIIADLVKRGFGFNADAQILRITLTGAY